MLRPRRLLATVTALLALAGLASGASASTASAALTVGDGLIPCVTGAELDQVEVGMTLDQAQQLLQDRAVWWGPEQGTWSQSYPKPCSSTRAMLIQADDGRVTYVVNEGERRDPTCTTAAEFDRLQDGMPRAEAARLLHGKQFDLRRTTEWQPVPCLGWCSMQVWFQEGRLVDHARGLYFG